MIVRSLLTTVAIAACVSGMAAFVATQAHARNAVEAEMTGFQQPCEKGDRRACVRFGILFGQNHADWRRAHADWWWWER